jgi:type IV secretion system protein VirB9
MRAIVVGIALLAVSGCASHTLTACGSGPRPSFIPSVSDDGQSTYLEFPAQTRIPAIYVVNPDGKEAMTAYSVDGGLVTVNQTAPEFRLRDGDAVVCIHNKGWTSIGASPGTGTTSPDVIRVPRQASR